MSVKGARSWLVSFLILVAGFGAGYAARYYAPHTHPLATNSDIRQRDRDGRLTNQLLECAELPEAISIGTRIDLEKEIRGIMDARIDEGKLSGAAVYFRDLNNGPWMGIDEERLFTPASLLKLPLAMAFYWQDENEPGLLAREVPYADTPEDYEAGQAFGSSKRLEDGRTYAAQELVDFMLQESSNEAALILSQILGEKRVLDIYEDLGIISPSFDKDYEISVHTFASFFRVLYNATYLDRVASERLLDSMTRSSFTQGIVAGVPAGTLVAHKFGTREIDARGMHQLHDCGIVYAGENPYVLCIMTEGKEYPELARFMRDVSAIVFDAVSSR